MSTNTGGPAFPSDNFGKDSAMGMTLLDWFAGQALACRALYNNKEYDSVPPDEYVADWAYDIAAAMLAEKAKREGAQ